MEYVPKRSKRGREEDTVTNGMEWETLADRFHRLCIGSQSQDPEHQALHREELLLLAAEMLPVYIAGPDGTKRQILGLERKREAFTDLGYENGALCTMISQHIASAHPYEMASRVRPLPAPVWDRIGRFAQVMHGDAATKPMAMTSKTHREAISKARGNPVHEYVKALLRAVKKWSLANVSILLIDPDDDSDMYSGASFADMTFLQTDEGTWKTSVKSAWILTDIRRVLPDLVDTPDISDFPPYLTVTLTEEQLQRFLINFMEMNSRAYLNVGPLNPDVTLAPPYESGLFRRLQAVNEGVRAQSFSKMELVTKVHDFFL